MPQLSPLSWIFLFMFFWVVVLMMAILIWWIKKVEFSLNVGGGSDNYSVVENKWGW
uniref:ATP synthase F0 subunit 8 n=1 Tax=Margarya melanioides TaxID=888545 RepID=A0A219YQE7_9CAEN|nr:ATP synthase F0 subunit 8 [Margarya melanioides]AQT38726.1 ATP synthase F0 subunit 8 [Margarya melanioides]